MNQVPNFDIRASTDLTGTLPPEEPLSYTTSPNWMYGFVCLSTCVLPRYAHFVISANLLMLSSLQIHDLLCKSKLLLLGNCPSASVTSISGNYLPLGHFHLDPIAYQYQLYNYCSKCLWYHNPILGQPPMSVKAIKDGFVQLISVFISPPQNSGHL